ncbi:MAG: glycosyltransferase family 4 protein [Acidobacteria bacterium]|nr:glycosyltransferase family 4 protein [Acidobacteriota bacterium]
MSPRHGGGLAICALVPYPTGIAPGQRFRLEQWAAHASRSGIAMDFVPSVDEQFLSIVHQPGRTGRKVGGLIASFLRRMKDVMRCRRYDAVVIYRSLCLGGPAVLERVLAGMGRPIIFDFDDAIFLEHTTESNRRFGWLKFPGKTAAICRASTHVIVGNSFLADYARQHNPHTTVIPTSLDTERYKPQARNGSSPVVVGWTGSSTSQTHLEAFAPILRELMLRRPVELRVLSNRRPNLPGLQFSWRPWSADTEVRELAEFDIGIMPMPDDVWSKGKCALKALQCMAMGTATICSAVGANCDVIRNGQNGFLASTTEEWLTHLLRLVDDPVLRDRIGRAGRETVEQGYSMVRSASLFADVVRQVVTRRGPDA